MYYVYWIKYFNHSDPYKDGYVGITNNPKKRFKYHSNIKSSDNPILLNAIKKGAEIYEIHTVCSKEEALKLEEMYRPHESIGWNIIKGGSAPPSQKGKKFGSHHGFKGGHHTNEHKQKMSMFFKQQKWYNDGTINKRSISCPEGFVEGRLVYKSPNLSTEGRKKIGRAGKAISTPFGTFNTIRAASITLDIKENKVSYYVHNSKYCDWYFIEK